MYIESIWSQLPWSKGSVLTLLIQGLVLESFLSPSWGEEKQRVETERKDHLLIQARTETPGPQTPRPTGVDRGEEYWVLKVPAETTDFSLLPFCVIPDREFSTLKTHLFPCFSPRWLHWVHRREDQQVKQKSHVYQKHSLLPKSVPSGALWITVPMKMLQVSIREAAGQEPEHKDWGL